MFHFYPMDSLARKFYTESEYLALEKSAEYKSEFYKGEIFAMAGASALHNRLVRNLTGLFWEKFRNRPCNVYATDLRVRIDKSGLYTYPDLVIVCGKEEYLDTNLDTLTNPTILLEVLSDSTEKYDRGQKFSFYREIPSLEEYILVSSREIKIEKFKRVESGNWLFSESKIGEPFPIESIDAFLNLEDVYEKIDWSVVENKGLR